MYPIIPRTCWYSKLHVGKVVLKVFIILVTFNLTPIHDLIIYILYFKTGLKRVYRLQHFRSKWRTFIPPESKLYQLYKREYCQVFFVFLSWQVPACYRLVDIHPVWGSCSFTVLYTIKYYWLVALHLSLIHI